jgi:hypothetical protein
MTVKEFFQYFKDNPFKYIAKGVQGGKDSLHTIKFSGFGSVGPYAYIEKTFNFIVEQEKNGEVITEEISFKNFSSISDDVLAMELISLVKIRLRGNNRTNENYWNDNSDITIMCKQLKK